MRWFGPVQRRKSGYIGRIRVAKEETKRRVMDAVREDVQESEDERDQGEKEIQ